MSVSGWETRAIAREVATEHHRYSLQASRAPSRHYNGDAHAQPYRSGPRQSEAMPRHYSFAQPPQQYERNITRQTEMRQRRQSIGHHALPSRTDLVRQQLQQQQQHQRDDDNQYYPRERMSMPQAPAYYREEPRYEQQRPTRRQSSAQYQQGRRLNPSEVNGLEPQPLPHYEARGSYQRDNPIGYVSQLEKQHYVDLPEEYGPQPVPDWDQSEEYDHYPSAQPTPVTRRRSSQQLLPPPPPAHPLAQSPDEPQANLDEVLLGKRWNVQIISYLYHFQRAELGEYANELVKFLRGHAVMTYEQEFGYSVTIHFNSDCVVFQVVEARDLHAEFLIEKMEQPQRPEMMQVINPRELEERHRIGSFAVFFPRSAENPIADPVRRQNGVGPHRYSNGSRSNYNGSENSQTSSSASYNQRREAKYSFLIRGNSELMAWVTSWFQRRFQCSIGKYIVQVAEENLRRVARNWVMESLEREEKVGKAIVRNAEKTRKASGVGGDTLEEEAQLPSMGTRAPVLLKYQSRRTTDAVKSFTVTMPWAAMRRYYVKMHSTVSSALGGVPEILDRVEKEYFGHVAKDLAAMELIGFQMDEVEVDTKGTLKFYKSTMIHSILQSYLDVLSVQQAPTAVNGEVQTTF